MPQCLFKQRAATFLSRRPVRAVADARPGLGGNFQGKVTINERLLAPTQKPAAAGEPTLCPAASAAPQTWGCSRHGARNQRARVSGGDSSLLQPAGLSPSCEGGWAAAMSSSTIATETAAGEGGTLTLLLAMML